MSKIKEIQILTHFINRNIYIYITKSFILLKYSLLLNKRIHSTKAQFRTKDLNILTLTCNKSITLSYTMKILTNINKLSNYYLD